MSRTQIQQVADILNGWLMELDRGVAQVTFRGQQWQLLGFSEQGLFVHLLRDEMETAREFCLGQDFCGDDVARWTVETVLQWSREAAAA